MAEDVFGLDQYTTPKKRLTDAQYKAIAAAAKKFAAAPKLPPSREWNPTRDATPYRPSITTLPKHPTIGVGMGGGPNDPRPIPQPSSNFTPKPKSNSGGGTTKKSTGGGTGSSDKSMQDYLNELYNSLIGELTTQKEGSTAEYDKTKGVITDQYVAAQADLMQKYQATQNPIAIQAANLGVDYNNSSIKELQDAALKRIDENGDLDLAGDQAYLDKMKLVQSGAFDALLQGSRNDQAQALIAAKQAALARAAGRRSSGGGGGGGSSGEVKETGSLTGTSLDSGINALLSDLPSDQANYLQQMVDRWGSPEAALSWAQRDANPTYANVPRISGGKLSFQKIKTAVKSQAAKNSNQKAAQLANTATAVQKALRQITKQYGGVQNVYKTTQTGRN